MRAAVFRAHQLFTRWLTLNNNIDQRMSRVLCDQYRNSSQSQPSLHGGSASQQEKFCPSRKQSRAPVHIRAWTQAEPFPDLLVERRGSNNSASTSSDEATAAYIHLPFCKRKCFYCDFPVIATGSRTDSPEIRDTMKEYVDLLIEEIGASVPVGCLPLKTLYFGGGTPSLIAPQQLDRLIKAVDRRFGIAAGAEISMEADPGTFDAERLRQYMSLGLTRFSVGVQAFQEDLLELCGRSHTLYDVYKAIEDVHTASPPSWSLDLISGLPHLIEEKWRDSLSKAVDSEPPHISVEDGTPFAKRYTAGDKPLPSAEDAAAMYRAASYVLIGAGFEHYEISNFAKTGHRCQHNEVYWEGNAQYHAFGLGAASYLQSRRFSRPRGMGAYKQWVAQFAASGAGFPGSPNDSQDKEEEMTDVVMMRLRTADGLDLKAFEDSYGSSAARSVASALEPCRQAGLVQKCEAPHISSASESRGQVTSREDVSVSNHASTMNGNRMEHDLAMSQKEGLRGKRVRLTNPEGFLVSNDVISDVFAALAID